jgi:hypothetical protein
MAAAILILAAQLAAGHRDAIAGCLEALQGVETGGQVRYWYRERDRPSKGKYGRVFQGGVRMAGGLGQVLDDCQNSTRSYTIS